jgi:ferredoxin
VGEDAVAPEPSRRLGMKSTTVTVRPDRCVASGSCEQMAPDSFSFNEDGVSVWVGDVARFSAQELHDIAQRCPVRAIEVVSEDADPLETE